MTASITALVPWFGCNRLLAQEPAKLLRGCAWVGVPFGGGMPELAHLDARTILVGDLHRHQINLARAVGNPKLRPQLVERLQARILHPDELEQAQQICREIEAAGRGGLFGLGEEPDPLEWAEAYFVCSWMGRSGNAGTKNEFSSPLATRWDAGGGDSVKRYRSAVEAVEMWGRVFERCGFETIDAFDFIARCYDGDRKLAKTEPAKREKRALYIDATWPVDGDGYKHRFPESSQRRLARELVFFEHYLVVVRYGDHPLIRELYPEDRWTWIRHESRDQDNKAVAEVLLVNRPGATP